MKGSMNIFIPTSKHIDILNEIGRWKVISLQRLFVETGKKMKYSPFCRTLKNLEANGLVKSYVGDRKRKYVTLSVSGSKYSIYNASHVESEAEVAHDLLASALLRFLLEFENFKSGYILADEFEVVPDALIHAQKKGREYVLALELELTQKSKKRLISKLLKYESSSSFDYVLYVTNKTSLYDSYRKTLMRMNNEIQKKVILLLDEELSEMKSNYLESKVFFKGEKKSFTEVFL